MRSILLYFAILAAMMAFAIIGFAWIRPWKDSQLLMLGYFLYWARWISWRVVVTLCCIFTIQNIIHRESNVWIHTEPLLIAAICLIIAIRIWSVKPDHRSFLEGTKEE